MRLGFAPPAGFGKIQFTRLEEEMYGTPIYKQKWFRAKRAPRAKREEMHSSELPRADAIVRICSTML
jgi:hypothetical protein